MLSWTCVHIFGVQKYIFFSKGQNFLPFLFVLRVKSSTFATEILFIDKKMYYGTNS